MAFKVLQVDHIGIGVNDLAATKELYKNALGIEHLPEDEIVVREIAYKLPEGIQNTLERKEPFMEKTLHVEGMMCQHCVAHVKKALEGVAGVASVDVDLDGKKATVQLAENVADAQLIDAVVDAGYEANMA